MRIIKESPEDLIRAKKLIDEGEHDDALLLINNLEENRDTDYHDIAVCHLLKCELFYQQGLFEKILETAKQTYKDSLRLGVDLLSIDALIWIARALIYLFRFDKVLDKIGRGEKLIKTLSFEFSSDTKQREASLAFAKGLFSYWEGNDVDKALEQFEYSLTLREKFGAKNEMALSIIQIAWLLSFGKGELDRAFKFVERGLTIAKENNFKFNIAWGLQVKAAIYNFKGEIDHSIMFYKQSLSTYEELSNKFMVANVLNNLGGSYVNKGELGRALECLEHSLEIRQESGNLRDIAIIYEALIQVLIEKGDLERAEYYLHRWELLMTQLKDKQMNLWYLFDKALLLKTSLRARNRVKAEEILNQILEDEDVNNYYELNYSSLLNLCELLLIELRITGDLEIIDELKPLIIKLINITEKNNSYSLLAETYFLQARLALITFDLKEARRFLTQAQQITEKHGYNQLAMKISNEHDMLLKQLSIWENLKEKDAPLNERMDLARLSDYINHMPQKHVISIPILETEKPIFLAIISKEGSMIVSNPFTADMIFDTNSIGDFLSSFNTFSYQIFHESLDRVVFGKYKVLMNNINQFYICYMFHGQTYSAKQKISHFTEIVKKEKNIIESLENAYNKNLIINVNENSMLEEIIVESFMSDPQLFRVPFKAYFGDEPFVFVSYAHANKLEVYPILDYLNKMGINIWYDEGIPVSENWQKSIAENLERCSKFLVFISPHILNSEMVKKEISFALKKKKKFVAVYLKETKLPTELEFQIADIQALIKYRISESEFYMKIKEVLNPLGN